MEQQLLSQIRDFLKCSGMGPAYFGKLACGNSELVNRLESGKTVTLRTAERIRAFIASRTQSPRPPNLP